MENIPPDRPQMYYSKAISLLRQSACNYQQSLKRRTIYEMISQEKMRRLKIETIRQDRMDNIFKSKSNHRFEMALTQSQLREQLQTKRSHNNLIRQMCRRSIEESKRLDYDKKRQTASNIKTMIESNHKRKMQECDRQMKRSCIGVKQKYENNRKATISRYQKNLSYRDEVIQKNSSQMQIMLKKANKYNFLEKKNRFLITEMSFSGSVHE